MEKFNWCGGVRKEYKEQYRKCLKDEKFSNFGAFLLKYNDYLNVRLYHVLSTLRVEENVGNIVINGEVVELVDTLDLKSSGQ